MAIYDIDYLFRVNDENQLAMYVEIDNPNRTLKYTPEGWDDTEDFEIKEGEETLNGVRVRFHEGTPSNQNPNPLIFKTRLHHTGQRLGMIVAVDNTGSINKEKKRRKTSVTVSSGGGL